MVCPAIKLLTKLPVLGLIKGPAAAESVITGDDSYLSWPLEIRIRGFMGTCVALQVIFHLISQGPGTAEELV